MKNIVEKQLIEWREELAKQKQKQAPARKVLEEASQPILLLEGGIQFGESLLRQIEEANPKSGTVELGQQSETTPSKK